MSKHTPGPWYPVGAWVEHPNDNVADICTCDPLDIGQGHLGRSKEETFANAVLIAAAPDLLKALRRLLRVPDFDGTKETSRRRLAAKRAARDAISMATGSAL